VRLPAAALLQPASHKSAPQMLQDTAAGVVLIVLAPLGAVTGLAVLAFHRRTQCSDRQFACLLSRDLPVSADRHPFADTVTVSVIHEVRAAPLGCTKTPKPLNSLHHIVNCLSRGVAASTTDLVNFGIWEASQKLTKDSPREGKGAGGEIAQ
jgi:hypothetical protein